ncbi:hypothetical protein AMATHDRAFT_146695 [Amanita thiersii Skay4041]|uniref:Endosomal/vacuolar adapter protein YPT35 n=1 Tax=Amanita thiersii Skay4041 TaxID=703135 RepID=A0A2A9NQ47_9AGAR|nr:hypothetical protein AMATHDRAFT_146695 [Amanita thiersii Skay4041]
MSLDDLHSPASTVSPVTPTFQHPFANTTGKLQVIHDNGKIDVEEEARLYESLVTNQDAPPYTPFHVTPRSLSPSIPASVYSKDIWLDDNSGASSGFAQDVDITGWTSVGDKKGGAYIVYDCAIKTKEGTIIHTHRRYTAFLELDVALQRTLPRYLLPSIPPLPPKAPFSRFRPAFLDHRRRQLQYWLSAVLLHPEIGASKAVKTWVME